MFKAVIVDDEVDAIESVKFLLAENFSSISIVGTAQCIKDARKVIGENKPDIVFLDIEMPDGTGFDLLESIPDRKFKVVQPLIIY